MRIQSFADVLICDQGWQIRACSASLRSRQLDERHASAESLIGQPLADIYGGQFAHDARGWGQSLSVSSRQSKSFGYQYNDQLFDVTCLGGGDAFCLLLELSARGPAVAPDFYVRRLLQRARGANDRQQALDSAIKVLRLALRADSVSMIQASPDPAGAIVAHDAKPKQADMRAPLSPTVQEVLLQDPGIVTDASAEGSWLFGELASVDQLVPAWVRQSSTELLTLFMSRGFQSAHWYVGSTVRGDRCCLLVEHQAAGVADLAKRHAAELAFEVLLLILDAEHPTSPQPGL